MKKASYLQQKQKTAGLVDKVAYFTEVIDELTEFAGYNEQQENFNQVGLESYIRDIDLKLNQAPRFLSNKLIAVVYAEGVIVDGEGISGQIGGASLARELRYLRQDSDVAAIVLRINSPGGSAIAAEEIQREVRETMETKPVVISMGSLAASGGYWMAVFADKIFAEPNTITGSIGVWGVLFNVKKIANEHGIYFDGIKTSTYADLFTISRPKTEQEMALIQVFTDFIYDEFINKVAEGRAMPIAEVNKIAQGRIWTGEQALSIGLVDQMGGLNDAINYAAKKAELGEDWNVLQIPRRQQFSETIQEIISQGEGDAPVVQHKQDWFNRLIDKVSGDIGLLKTFNDPRGIYARMPFNFRFE